MCQFLIGNVYLATVNVVSDLEATLTVSIPYR